MSQTYSTWTTAEKVNAILAKISDQLAAERSTFSGTGAPSTPVAGEWWLDTDTPSATVWTLKIYDGTDWIECARIDTTNNVVQLASGIKATGALDMNSNKINNVTSGTASGEAANKGQVDGRIEPITVPIGTLSASDEFVCVHVPSNCTIIAAKLTSETATSGSSAGTRWEFNVRNLTAAVNLASANKVTSAAEIAADTVYDLGLDQNLTPAANDVLELQVTKTGAPTSPLNACVLSVQYKISV